jgi:hypothetical protein
VASQVVRIAVAATTLVVMLAARPALAEGICDPQGHFCFQIDTTSAHVCNVREPGRLDPANCTQQDDAVRNKVRAHPPLPLRAVVIHYDDDAVLVSVARYEAHSELPPSDLHAHDRDIHARLAGAGMALDESMPATMRRVHDVQVARFGGRWVSDGVPLASLVEEVRARDATYWVYFESAAGKDLAAYADDALSTLDALPATSGHGGGEALMWLVRGVMSAVGLAVGFLLVRRLRGRGGMDARDLWPH